MSAEYGPPTVQEGVNWILAHKHNKAYCRECIRHWREKYGDVLADQIQAKARAAWGKSK